MVVVRRRRHRALHCTDVQIRNYGIGQRYSRITASTPKDSGPPVVCSTRDPKVDDYEQRLLNQVAERQVSSGKTVSLATVRATIMAPPMEDKLRQRVDDALARLVPRLLEKHTEAGGGSAYTLTLDGWMESRYAQQAGKVIEDMLHLYRKRVQHGNADFNSIPWAEVATESRVDDDLIHLYVAVSHKAGLTNGYSSISGAPGAKATAHFNRPNDLDEIVNVKSAADLLRHRRREQQERVLLAGRKLPSDARTIMVRAYGHLVRDGDWPLTKLFNVELRDGHIRLDEVGLANGDLIRGLDTYQAGERTHLTLRAVALLEDAEADAAWVARVVSRLGERYAKDPDTTEIPVKEVAAEVGLLDEKTLARVVRIVAAQGGTFTVQGRPAYPLATSTFGVGEWFLDFRDAHSLAEIVRAVDDRLRQNWTATAPTQGSVPHEAAPIDAQESTYEDLSHGPTAGSASDQRATRDIPCAVVLTALRVEYTAVCDLLLDVHEITHRQGTVYGRGRFERSGRRWDIVLAEIGAGNNRAAVEVERAINEFEPEVVMFVGVAGGVKDVKLGDVVAATKVYGYESGKVTSADFEPRPDVGRSSYRMEQRAKSEARKVEWRDLSSDAVDSVAHVGPIAAGEKVVASKRSATAKFIKHWYGDSLAVEMEGRGFLEATHANHIDAIVVRGISDLLSGKRQADKVGWQKAAARNAAAFAMHLLSRFAPPMLVRAPLASEDRRARDLETLRRVLLSLPTTVMDFFFEQAQVDIIQADGVHFWEGFNGEVTGSHFVLFDTGLAERIRAFHAGLQVMLSFDEHVVPLPSGQAYKFSAVQHGRGHGKWERDHTAFQRATQTALKAYSAFIDYVTTAYPEIDLLKTTKEALTTWKKELADLKRQPKGRSAARPRRRRSQKAPRRKSARGK